ncbi:MAG: CocE/NonD family hydrolase [Gemmatimonadales bacterium]
MHFALRVPSRARRWPWRRAAALLPLVLAAGQPAEERLDVYVAGIKVAELTSSSPERFSLRVLDREAHTWSAARIVTGDQLAADRTLPRVLRAVAPALRRLERLDWAGAPAISWPDAETSYRPVRRLEATVAGRTVSATRWAHHNGSRPIDLVIGPSNRVLAAMEVSSDVVLVRRGYEGFTTVARWNAPTISPARYGYRLHERVMVPMADGVRLATLVYHPTGAGDGPFPTVFVRTPYGISGLINQYWHYAARGYAVVLQAARGTAYWDQPNRSEGEWVPMINEPADGKSAIEWLGSQPWSDGVCMQGGSYVGYTQWTLSMADHPALKCLIPESSMGTAFSDQPFWGGTMVEGMAYYAFYMLDIPLLPGRIWNEILHHRPLADIDVYATGRDIPQWNMFFEHQTNDDFWARQDWYRSDAPRRFSAFQISGWFDDDFPGTESNWNLMQRLGVGPQRLVIGPWKHGYNADRRLAGYEFGPDALRDDIWLAKQAWYDQHLKGQGGISADERVQYFVLGSNEWRSSAAWPPAEASPVSWYLHGDGEASRLTTRGRLDRQAPTAAETPDRFRYDPANPPANWYSFDQMQRWEDVQTFPYDFKDIEARPDVAVYTSEPLEEDLTIAGDVKVILYASTDVKDTDWWVHLADVDTTGRSNRITVGARRARFRDNADPVHNIRGENYRTERLLSGDPGDVVRYEFSLRSIANTFRAGHRIRVAVMNAMDNYSFPNSNTGEDEGKVSRTVVGRMAIHKSAEHPTQIVLPVLRGGRR